MLRSAVKAALGFDRLTTGVVGVLAALVSVSHGQAIAQSIEVVSFKAVDVPGGFRFEGPGSIPSGWVTLSLENLSDEEHHIQIFSLSEGRTMLDVITYLQDQPDIRAAELPSWATFSGGPGSITPGGEARATVNLAPGNAMMLCFVENLQGISHTLLGMLQPVAIANSAQQAPEPQAALTIGRTDTGFDFSAPVTPGTHTIRVVNNGTQPHESEVVLLDPGATPAEFIRAAIGENKPPPMLPGKTRGGIMFIERGAHGYFTTDFVPGNYFVFSMLFRPQEGQGIAGLPFVVQEFTVAEGGGSFIGSPQAEAADEGSSVFSQWWLYVVIVAGVVALAGGGLYAVRGRANG